jgi:Caudovirus prohead serine protease
VFEQRAFAKGIGDGCVNVVANLEHDPARLLGTVESGTLTITDTRDGLDYTIDLPATTAGNDALEYVSRGLMRGSSVAMQVYSDHFEMRGAGLPVRHLEGVRLTAISPVSMRSFATQFDADLDDVVRDAQTGQLSRYFSDKHPVVIDVGVSGSGGVAVAEQRSDTRTPAQRLLELYRRKLEWNAPVDTRTAAERLTALYCKRLEWRAEPVEEKRGLDSDFARDSGGYHARDWHPAHQ